MARHRAIARGCSLERRSEILFISEKRPILLITQHAPSVDEALPVHFVGVESSIIAMFFGNRTVNNIGHSVGHFLVRGDGKRPQIACIAWIVGVATPIRINRKTGHLLA
jgi:hypothetical protein